MRSDKTQLRNAMIMLSLIDSQQQNQQPKEENDMNRPMYKFTVSIVEPTGPKLSDPVNTQVFNVFAKANSLEEAKEQVKKAYPRGRQLSHYKVKKQ